MKVCSLMRFSLPLTWPLLVLACSNEASLMSAPDDLTETVLDENGIGIINGSAPSEAVKASTVALLTSNSLCSGTILSERHILTASHCVVDDFRPRQIVFGETYLDKPGSAVRPITRPVVRIFNENRGGRISFPDIAIVEFVGGLPPGYVPAKLPQENEQLGEGSSVTIAGYGRSNIANNNSGVVLQGQGTYAGVSPGFDPDSIGLVFLRIKRSILFPGLDPNPQQHCHGDSGGPTYIFKGGQLVVLGVTSHGERSCTEGSHVTDVRQQLPWIRKIVGVIPQPPATPVPTPQTPAPTPQPPAAQPPAPQPPTTQVELSPIGNIKIEEDATFSVPVKFKGDGMTCESSLAAVPQGNTLITASRLKFRTDPIRGCILEGSPLANANGQTKVNVQLKRGRTEVVAQQSFSLTLTAVNDAPTLVVAPSVRVWAGSEYLISATIKDVDSTLSCARDLKAESLDSFLVFNAENDTENLKVSGGASYCQIEFYAMSATSQAAKTVKVQLTLKDNAGAQTINTLNVVIRPR